MFYDLENKKIKSSGNNWIAPNATIIGNVIIGKNVYVGPGASLRGDWGQINISDGCNIQDNCTIHIFPGKNVTLMENAHIGHGAIVHGATIGKNTLVGMNAVIMDDCIIGDECIIGALTFIKGESKIENRKIVMGNPGIIKGVVSDKMIEWKKKGTELYHNLPKECKTIMKECKPLIKLDSERKKQNITFDWNL